MSEEYACCFDGQWSPSVGLIVKETAKTISIKSGMTMRRPIHEVYARGTKQVCDKMAERITSARAEKTRRMQNASEWFLNEIKKIKEQQNTP